MTVAGGGGVAHPEETGRREVALRCLDLAGVVEYDGAGRAVVFRRRCRNRRCCPPRDGFVAVHCWDIDPAGETGAFVTRYVPTRAPEELLGRPTPPNAGERVP